MHRKEATRTLHPNQIFTVIPIKLAPQGIPEQANPAKK